MHCIIGIDAGTEQVKTALFDLHGHLLQQTALHNERLGDVSNYYELDMNQVWDNTIQGIRSLMRLSSVMPEEIAAIGVTGSPGGLWAIDQEGIPVMHAITVKDNRAIEEAREINVKTPGIGKLVHRNLGHPAGKGSPLALLKWLKINEPEAYAAASIIFFEKDWIRYKLTNRIATDYSDGSDAFFRLNNGGIPTQLMTVLGLNDIVNKIPGVLSGDAVAGQLSQAAADVLGLNSGIPVSVGSVSQVCAALGAGVCQKNDCAVFLDDEISMLLLRDKKVCDPGKTGRFYIPDARKDMSAEKLNVANGCSNIQWALDVIAPDDRKNKVDEGAPLFLSGKRIEQSELKNDDGCVPKLPSTAEGVIYYPFLSDAHSGKSFERNNAVGQFFGIRSGTTKPAMLRAVYESIGFALKESFEISGDIGSTYLIKEDFSKEVFLPQIIADITEKDLYVAEGSCLAAKGAAMLAGIAAGHYENTSVAIDQCCREYRKVQSNPDPLYAGSFQLYSALRRVSAPMQQLYHETYNTNREE